MKRFLILFLLACSLPVDADALQAKFHVIRTESGPATCNGGETDNNANPIVCEFVADKLDLHLHSWGEGGKVTIEHGSGGENTVTGICQNAFPESERKTTSFDFHPSTVCRNPNAGPPPATGDQILHEWYTDLPWHQKLSTLDSNLIDVPFVLPCEALSQTYRDKVDPPITSKEACRDEGNNLPLSRIRARAMLRYGILDVMGMERTDRVYKDNEGPTPGKECKGDRPCVEVKLEIGRYNTQTDDPIGYKADEFRDNQVWYDLKNEKVSDTIMICGKDKDGKDIYCPSIASLGLAVTESTIFAPWRNWYTGHYCAKKTDSLNTSVCYDDYWTANLQAAAANPNDWLSGDYQGSPTPYKPAIFWPRGKKDDLFQIYCQAGKTSCNMALGKVHWEKGENPIVESDKRCMGDPKEDCEKQIADDIKNLDDWFRLSLDEFKDGKRYPWSEMSVESPDPEIPYNPFIGFYEVEVFGEQATSTNIDSRLHYNSKYKFKSPSYVLPKKCDKDDYRLARQANNDSKEKEKPDSSISHLSDCAVNYEIHTSGFHEMWKDLYYNKEKQQNPLPLLDDAVIDITKIFNGLGNNQYGRTMFLYAGVPEQHVPVSFRTLDDGMSIHDKVYSGSIYVQYLPMVNPADRTLTWDPVTGENPNTGSDPLKNYKDDFWHAFFMSNHMNQDPDHFIRGIVGRTLWHNEYRSNLLYKASTSDSINGTEFEKILGHVDFPAGFQTGNATAPFHGNTCDACHVRNGSGIPLMPNGELSPIHIGMNANYHVRAGANHGDYTYTNIAYPNQKDVNNIPQEVPSMKMVFFDLQEQHTAGENICDDDNQTVGRATDNPYQNKIMNYYGNSLPLDQNNHHLTYKMEYVDIKDGDGFVIVDNDPTARGSHVPKRVKIDTRGISAGDVCDTGYFVEWGANTNQTGPIPDYWPTECTQVDGAAIQKAIDGDPNSPNDTTPKIGFMHLMGRRLGNSPLIEMMPDKEITAASEQQKSQLGVNGCIGLAPGTRLGTGTGEDKDSYNYRSCTKGDKSDCYISRWGWIGDRASLEDQVANAAHVEMNITSAGSYNTLYGQSKPSEAQLVRYDGTMCGPANEHCGSSSPNSNITEQEIRDMATYQRWIGIPNRSEYQVASQKVQVGEQIFKDLQCNSCHVIKKIPFDYSDNMLPDEERTHLQSLEIKGDDGKVEYPFVAYLGTDLLLHDMGYLSQVAPVTEDDIKYHRFRDTEGKVQPAFRNYVQYIRTPALKGLRFNRFVTDSNHNTTDADIPLGKGDPPGHNFTQGCDFLLHDGRACDAIEAALLHDGPEVKALGMIEKLNGYFKDKDQTKLDQLRAFLYSL